MKSILFFPPVLAMILGFAACDSAKTAAPKAPEVVRNVAVIKTAGATVPDVVTALGTIRALQSSQLSAQVMGVITTVNVREGDFVKRGQLLVELDSSQAQAALERAEASAIAAGHELAAAESERNIANTTLQRYTSLFERKSVSPQEYDEVKARSAGATARADAAKAGEAQARAAVAQAKTSLSYTRIRAPFDGVVTERKIDPGAMASPGTPLVTVETFGKFRAEVLVDESNLRFVKEGQHVQVRLDAYPDQPIAARVAQIVPAADSGSRTFLLKLDLPANPALRSGLSVTAMFPRGNRETLMIPQHAVVDRGAMKGVYVLDQNQVASLRYVTLGQAGDGTVEVLSGLSANERIVESPADRELAGKRIEAE